MLRFLADECCPRLIVKALREAGHDVRYATESDRGASDDSIATVAFTDDRVILTEDYDFGELAIRFRRPMIGVVLLAPSDQTEPVRAARLIHILSNVGNQIRGCLTIVEDDRLRIRSLESDG